MGWTQNLEQGANLFDAMNLNTRATGNWSGKPPELPFAWRPSATPNEDATGEPEPKRRVSVADLFDRFKAAS